MQRQMSWFPEFTAHTCFREAVSAIFGHVEKGVNKFVNKKYSVQNLPFCTGCLEGESDREL